MKDIKRKIDKVNNIGDFLKIWFDHQLIDGDYAKVFNGYYASFKNNFSRRIKSIYTDQTNEIMDLIKNKQNPKLLEIGCGLGTESLWFSHMGANVDAVDVNTDRLNCARERLRVLNNITESNLQCRFHNKSVLDINKKYDIIWMEQTFHHLEPRKKIVEKIADLLNKGGYLVIADQNSWNIPLQLQLFKQRGFPKVVTVLNEKGDKILYGDERITTAKRLIKLFNKSGIQKKSIRHYRVFPNHRFFEPFQKIESTKIFNKLTFMYTNYNYVGEKI